MRGKLSRSRLATAANTRFNEARALCAGNSTAESHAVSGFNEARALCAGNCWRDEAPCCPHTCFNEARALCAGNWPSLQPAPPAARKPPMREVVAWTRTNVPMCSIRREHSANRLIVKE